ncbi:MAG: hypothetical protein FJ197_07095 [Gammaproteobacteria bacterium]|nr:hypothetical protein [Gammaproteobacteria bacterium]
MGESANPGLDLSEYALLLLRALSPGIRGMACFSYAQGRFLGTTGLLRPAGRCSDGSVARGRALGLRPALAVQ